MTTSTAVTSTEALEISRRAVAERLFADYDFGDNVMVVESNGWSFGTGSFGVSEWTRFVYVEVDGQEESERYHFMVYFKQDSVEVQNHFASDSKGNTVGG